MRRHLFTAALTLLLPASALAQAPTTPAAPARPPLTLTTTAWADGAQIPVKYTQAGEQVSPALAWTNVPPGTQSFVLHMRDPDVARNKTSEDQVHWLVWNIPGTATGMAEAQPKGPTLPDGSRQISASGGSIVGRARRPPGRCTTTRSSCLRSTPRSICRPAPMPGRRAPRSMPPCRATFSARRSTSGCSAGHSNRSHRTDTAPRRRVRRRRRPLDDRRIHEAT
jgi:phosphatidylethanolamine-binding protein (PEBP) family uncharacterized protein